MIGVRLDGRLGNQLFQYALAISLAKKFKTFYIIDNDYKADYVKKYFKTKPFLNNKLGRQLFKKWLAPGLPFMHQIGHETPDMTLPLLYDNQFYKGFFQSERYFQNVSSSIHKSLQVKKKYAKEFSTKYGHLFSKQKLLVIHYRLGDYLTWGTAEWGGTDMSLPETYYRNALKQIKQVEDYTVVIVTDDAKNMEGKLENIPGKLIISDTEIMDFQLMLHADKLIISNSSFAWWGAYLNKNKAEVFVPQYWLGFKVDKEIPADIIPARFISVPVR